MPAQLFEMIGFRRSAPKSMPALETGAGTKVNDRDPALRSSPDAARSSGCSPDERRVSASNGPTACRAAEGRPSSTHRQRSISHRTESCDRFIPIAVIDSHSVDSWLESRTHGYGAQLCLIKDGAVVASSAVGASGDVAMTRRHVVRVWCASKPLIACIAVAMLESTGVELSDSVQIAGRRADISWMELLNHSCDLALPDTMTALLLPRTARRQSTANAVMQTDKTPAYSEYVWGALLGDAIAERSGRAAADAVQAELDRMDLADDVFFTRPPEDRILPFQWGVGSLDAIRPSVRNAIDFDSVAAGAMSSAHGLAKAMDLIARCRTGDSVPGLPTPTLVQTMLEGRRPRVADRILSRTCTFGAGFAVQLADHGYGPRLSELAFGHSGAMGSSWVFHDPMVGLSAAFTRSSMVYNSAQIDAERQAVIDAIYSWL